MKIQKVEDYLARGCGRCDRFDTPECSTTRWAQGLAELRRICLAAGLEETVKWGQPCYRHAGRNIAIIGAFRDSFVLGFFHAALMKDPEGVLEKPGPNTQHADTIRFRDNAEPAGMDRTVRDYLAEAQSYAETGQTAPRTTRLPDLPDELIAALDADPDLAEAFHALTPGRQRSYVINLSTAKASETRMRRIAKFREKIIAGKGANER
ncbi:YdeI/OmpD-associated family protein [Roseobacter sinensis]|uniref:YdeI/OmpD-associated family protein n=1 Tax=Roseobacter sinensis TaxID=2931391 RepID=A0ABT3BB92_9RHOB|nr:YdeI/OmpD-associated family protein [Roseobacter sp. WL0113]MCV3270684.1 YdeI/OmpD-associated family protein [Roseobacter sp. WL0113]